ncbi:hypothetical protein BDV96DRAFT_583787 [Lophiotrema nucula]|uniref:SnoaL-like domain-containing protein n=1 Tax=Lophiotrema nucula TaxID=690887 RepID=A0A6A5YVZ8_9PLEO|nr:hypothetical protein BDV96DRAFT_583787 [Lophiotrema nucula]
MPSRERQTADAVVEAFNASDPHRIVALRSPTCTRIFLPSSLNFPAQDNSEYLAQLLRINGVFTAFKIVVDDVIEGTSTNVEGLEQKKKIVMYVKALGETAVGEYRNEYVWKMAFDEDARISEWSEFVDVGMARDFLPKLRAELQRRRVEAEDGEKS